MPEFYPNNFGGLPPEQSGLDGSRFVILPLPYEATTSYAKGTKFGPRAIIEASRNMELYDEELGFEPCDAGIHTTEDVLFSDTSPEAMVRTVHEAVGHYLAQGKFVVGLGGEHSLSYGAFLAHKERCARLGVAQVDAHADLRESYEGTPYNHACVMRRIVPLSAGTVQVGIRSLSREEAEFLKAGGTWPILWARECQSGEAWIDGAIESLPEKVYLTVDVDGLDPSLVPCTGTPEPGGLGWYPLLRFLRRLCSEREVVGMDVVELAPDRVHFGAEFLVARLVYKILGYVQASR
jgi:agmatinase